jgi:hypothetical protein
MRRTVRKGERGYNLIETIIAMGFMGTILVSAVTLFFMGRGNVYAGKQLTLANTIANSVLEDLSALTLAQTEQTLNFAVAGATPTALITNTVNGKDYPSSILRSTNALSADNAPNYLDRWKGMLAGASTVWLGTTYFAQNVTIVPPTANGFHYRATTAGTSAATAPTFPTTEGATVTDGTVTWTAIRPTTNSLGNSSVDVVLTPDLATRLLKIRVIVSYQNELKGSLGSQRREVVVETVKLRPI